MNLKVLFLASTMILTISISCGQPKENSIVYKYPKTGTALAMFAASALSVYKYYDDFRYYKQYDPALKVISLITCGVGLMCTKYWIYGTKSYFESAKSQINDNKKLIKFVELYCNINQDFMSDLKKIYSQYDLPLAYAFLHIKNLIKDSNLIVEWLNVVTEADTEEELQDEAKEILKQFNPNYFWKLHQILLIIKEDPSFLAQIQLFENQEAVYQMRQANLLRAISRI